MTELKPCPFCGGNAHLTFSGTMGDIWKGFIICRCKGCGASAKGMYYFGKPIDMDLCDTIGGEEAIEAWNRRNK